MSSPGWGGGQAPGWKPGYLANKVKERRKERKAKRQNDQPQGGATSHQTIAGGEDLVDEVGDEYDEGEEEEGDDDGDAMMDDEGQQLEFDDSPKGKGWYPGKFAGKAFRKRARKFLAAPKEESQRRLDGAPMIGRLSLVFKGTIGVKLFNPFFSVWVEGVTKNVKPGRFMDNYNEEQGSLLAETEPQWDEALYLFDVTDITSDVHITLLDKRLRTFTIGRLILPLSNFLDVMQPKPATTYTFDIIPVELLDIDKKLLGQKYVPQMVIPSAEKKSAVNLVGQVVMEVELTTECNLLHTYLLSRPLLEDSFISRKKNQKKEEPPAEGMDTRQLVINIFRLKNALQVPPIVPLLLDSPIIFVPLFTICVRSPVWSFPLWLLSLIFANGWLGHRSRSIPNVEVWPKGLVEKVQQMEGTSAPTKIIRLRKLVKWLQDQLGVIASGLERSSNLWSWVDPHVTVMVEGSLTLGALFLAFILYLIPFQFLVWAIVMAVYTKVFLKRKAIRNRPKAKVSIKAKKGTGTGPEEPPASDEKSSKDGAAAVAEEKKRGTTAVEQKKTDEGGEDEEDEEDDYELIEFDWRDWMNLRKVLPALASNVFVRSPDYMEVLHRAFAKQRAQPAQNRRSSVGAEGGGGNRRGSDAPAAEGGRGRRGSDVGVNRSKND